MSETYIDKLETLCYELRNSIVDFNLKLPFIITFERYFNLWYTEENTKKEKKNHSEILYIINLLQEIRTLVYPDTIFDSKVDSETSDGSFLEKGLNSIGSKLSEKNDWGIIHTHHYINLQAFKDKSYYHKYYKNLFNAIAPILQRNEITLNLDFSITTKIIIDNIWKPEHLGVLYDKLEQNGYIEKGDKIKRSFLSLFNAWIWNEFTPIKWQDITSKSNENRPHTNYSSLYYLFEELGCKLEGSENKKLIARAFTDIDGELIDYTVLKKRKESEKIIELKKIIQSCKPNP